MLVLPGKFDAQVDESRGLNELDQGAKGDQLRCVHLDLSEAWDQTIGELVVARQEAESKGADRVR